MEIANPIVRQSPLPPHRRYIDLNPLGAAVIRHWLLQRLFSPKPIARIIARGKRS